MRGRIAFGVLLLTLAGCHHPEDRRWSRMTIGTERPGERPKVGVYAFSPAANGPMRLLDLSGPGQAALIDAFARRPAEAAALGQRIAAPLDDAGPAPTIDRTRLDRTIVIAVAKGPASLPGDRLMRTTVTIVPRTDRRGSLPFEFAGYAIAATDTRVQDIAKLQSESTVSLGATLAPASGALGNAGMSGALGRSRTGAADIVQQYEHLGIDITPQAMVVTRESERGLDIAGNTLVALTLAMPADSDDGHAAALVTAFRLADARGLLGDTGATVATKPIRYLARCPLTADVTLRYRLRRVVQGRQFYTEGKQRVEIVDAEVVERGVTLVAADAVQEPLYQLRDAAGNGVVVTRPGQGARPLLFDDFDAAAQVAAWLSAAPRATFGVTGPTLSIDRAPLRRGATYRADIHQFGCPPAAQATPVAP